MKILHIIDSGGLYGAEIMLLNLMSEQVAQGLMPILVSIGDPGVAEKPLEAEALRRGLRVELFRMRPGPNILGALEVLRFARDERADMLHSHGYKGNILFGFLPRFVRRMPMVSTVHGWTWSGGMTRMRIYEWLDSQSLAFVDRIITVSSAMKEHPRLKNRPGLSLDVVPNGIPLKAEHAGMNSVDHNQDIISFCSHGFTIGAIGRLSPEKGFASLLQVVSALSEQGNEIRLVILGEGGLRSSLEAAVRNLGIENKVLLPGYVRNAQQYLPFFSMFAMPSLTEGLPMVLLEAMQAGVPIVATRVGGIPDVLQEGRCGLLISPGCNAELEDGITKVMQNEEAAQERVAAARQQVDEVYSSRAMALKYLAIYRSVIS